MVEPELTPTRGRQAARRVSLRSTLWGEVSSQVWDRKKEKGFCTIPRTLSLVMTLIDELEKGRNASRVYFDLWCRVFDEGLVEISDIEDVAFSSGYGSSARNIRTWKERIDLLVKYGFVSVKPSGTRKYGYILLRHPHLVVQELRKRRLVPEGWFGAFMKRLTEIGSQWPV